MFGKENMWTYWYDKDGNPATGVNGKRCGLTFGKIINHVQVFTAKNDTIGPRCQRINWMEDRLD